MEAFDVVGDRVRRRILEILGNAPQTSGEVVAAIGKEFGITQAAVSQHLKVLRENGFATVRADGTRRIYSVDAAGLQAIDRWVGQFRDFWEPRLDALATEIARGKHQRRKTSSVQNDSKSKTTTKSSRLAATGMKK
jgi:DNA-binding transcriptional ArsR family regulator